MSTIRVASTGSIEQRLRRVEEAANFGEEVLCHGIVDEAGATVALTVMTIVGGWTIPWGEPGPIPPPPGRGLRVLLPDERWELSACGWLNNPGGCALQLTYQKDDLTQVVIGQESFATPFTWRKLRIGPFPARGVFVPAAVPQGELIHSWNLQVATVSGTVALRRWTMWLRMSPKST